MDPDQIIISAAILGLLLGIVWSLKYIVLIDKKLEALDKKIVRLLRKNK